MDPDKRPAPEVLKEKKKKTVFHFGNPQKERSRRVGQTIEKGWQTILLARAPSSVAGLNPSCSTNVLRRYKENVQESAARGKNMECSFPEMIPEWKQCGFGGRDILSISLANSVIETKRPSGRRKKNRE